VFVILTIRVVVPTGRAIKHNLGTPENSTGKRRTSGTRKTKKQNTVLEAVQRNRNQKFAQGVEGCLLANSFDLRTCEPKSGRRHQIKHGATVPRVCPCALTTAQYPPQVQESKTNTLHRFANNLCAQTPL